MAKRILLIDDSEFYLNAFKSVLEKGGYEVITAGSGTQGLEQLHNPEQAMRGGFNLILCDVTMPEMDGYGVLKQVKADPALDHIPLIFLTYLSDINNMDRALELGARDYFIKSDALLGRILELVNRVIG
jgi:CheY-like chemotaxis protein